VNHMSIIKSKSCLVLGLGLWETLEIICTCNL